MFSLITLNETDSMLNQTKSKFINVDIAYVPSVYDFSDLVTSPVQPRFFGKVFLLDLRS